LFEKRGFGFGFEKIELFLVLFLFFVEIFEGGESVGR
jgi:hypothetical protein